MKDKDKLFTYSLVFLFLIFFGVNEVIKIYRIIIADQKKDLPNRKPSIKERSNEIFNSKLNEAKRIGVSSLELSDGRINGVKPFNHFGGKDLIQFSAKIRYDGFTDQYYCGKKYRYQTVDPISKDIKIAIGSCQEKKGSRKCSGKVKFDDYIQYRANDTKEIRLLYKPELVIEVDDTTYYFDTKYKYYNVLPYSFFKDFEKITLRYNFLVYDDQSSTYESKSTYTSKFDINSVLLINNFQKRCGIKKSIFQE